MQWQWIDMALLAGRAAFLVFSFAVAAIAFTRWRRLSEREAQHTALALRQALEGIARLEQAVGELAGPVHQLESQAAARDAELTALTGRLHALARPESTPSQSSYDIAIRLARGGAQRDELVASCGLTRQEAELVARLHGPDRQRSGVRSAAA